MLIDYVPLLSIQREIHDVPRGIERFDQYLRVMLKSDRNDVELVPLVIVNPMAREHVEAMLDTLIGLDADAEAARACEELAPTLDGDPGPYKVSVVVADDAKGGWTNRYATEYGLRFGGWLQPKRPWIAGVLWSSEEATLGAVRETILAALLRADLQLRGVQPRTLGGRMRQEGEVLNRAGYSRPLLDPEESEYTREVIGPFLDTDDFPTAVACLFGDEAARSLGFTPMGLAPWAGISLAVEEARGVWASP